MFAGIVHWQRSSVGQLLTPTQGTESSDHDCTVAHGSGWILQTCLPVGLGCLLCRHAGFYYTNQCAFELPICAAVLVLSQMHPVSAAPGNFLVDLTLAAQRVGDKAVGNATITNPSKDPITVGARVISYLFTRTPTTQ